MHCQRWCGFAWTIAHLVARPRPSWQRVYWLLYEYLISSLWWTSFLAVGGCLMACRVPSRDSHAAVNGPPTWMTVNDHHSDPVTFTATDTHREVHPTTVGMELGSSTFVLISRTGAACRSGSETGAVQLGADGAATLHRCGDAYAGLRSDGCHFPSRLQLAR